MCSTSLFAQGAQTDPAITQVALDTANQMDKSHPKVVLSGPLRNCLRESALCLQVEAALHEPLQRTGNDAYFLTRDELAGALTKRGFLGIDAYDGEVLRLIASDLHADLLLTEDLLWNPQITGLATKASSNLSRLRCADHLRKRLLHILRRRHCERGTH
jgi:hypothetical protein